MSEQEFDGVPEESEQLDQLQEADSLINRGVKDVLDEGFIAPDHWSPAQGFGNTPSEMRQGETLEMRIKQEEPERTEGAAEWNPHREARQVGSERAGRLMSVQGSGHEDTLGVDVGISGGAASAEEAAMHIISDDEDDAPLED
ncbi:hypothetical protein SAMN02745244_00786 [Tessaracoccus bendigoensis DSM 12906]|uniref:DUF5709 domain-containing protein n=1 Tax=Tessaracoccus bendigoensis DSM 12906 TaxID=1123357 RepID=A0A1M6CYK4_9ACTN|nr:DUF5709 domain-containing protein [Tessaracoccus bendigoensis]SHI66102.1 hypothetical protein SAMN02745244_00786 [Tessaracoccus bendigoensis DSM 12906]